MADNNIIRIILEALDRNTAPVIQGATANVTKLGTATKLTAEQEKKLAGEFDGLLKRIDPAYAAQSRFTSGTAILEKGLKANVISQQQAVRGYQLLKAELDEAAKAATRADSEFTGLGRTIGPAAIAAAVLGIGKASLSAAQEAEQASARLQAILTATGGTAGKTSNELDALADAMARATRFDDEQWRGAIGTLLTFRNVSGDTFERALRLSGDLAEVMGTDVQSAARQLGRALEDPENGLEALARVGIHFTAAQREMIKAMVKNGDQAGAMNLVLEEMEGRVGGVAEKMNSGLTKATGEAGKAWSELLEAMGKTGASQAGVKTVFGGLTGYLTEMKDVVENGDWLDRLLFVAKHTTGALPFLPTVDPEPQEQAATAAEREEKAKAEIAALDHEIEDVTERRAKLEEGLAKETQALQLKNLGAQRDGIKEQIGGYERLRQAMLQAFADAGKAAEDASVKAQSLLDKAASTRQGAQNRLLERDLRNLPEDDQDAIRNRAINEALDKAGSARTQADYQRLLGNNEAAEKQLDLAEEQAGRAGELANALHDEGLAYRQITDAAEAAARIDESRAQVEQQRAQEAAQRQQDLQQQMADNDQRLADLNGTLDGLDAKIKALTAEPVQIKIEADQAAFDKLSAQLDELLRKKALLRNPEFTGVFDSQGNAVFREPPLVDQIPGLASGGRVGGNGTKGVDSEPRLLDPEEHVWTSDETDLVGGHHNMYRLRAMARAGMLRRLLDGSLQRFDVGGAASQGRAVRSSLRFAVGNTIQSAASFGSRGVAASPSPQPMTLNFPGFGAFDVSATRDVAESMRFALRRELLRKGGRR